MWLIPAFFLQKIKMFYHIVPLFKVKYGNGVRDFLVLFLVFVG